LVDLPPFCERGDIGLLHRGAVLVTDQVLHQDAQRHRQARQVADLLLDRRQAVIGVALGADFQRLAGLEAVGMSGGH
jgi:hypothetical protein